LSTEQLGFPSGLSVCHLMYVRQEDNDDFF
jgi:hypothetical protein